MIEGFKAFMFKHKIPATAAAFSVGGASAEMAKTMSNDIILPMVYMLLRAMNPRLQSPQMKFGPFFASMVSWACVLITSYFLMEVVFSRGVIGASLNVLNTKEEAELNKAQNVVKQPIQQASKAIQNLVSGTEPNSPYANLHPAKTRLRGCEPDAFDLDAHCSTGEHGESQSAPLD